MTEEQKNRMIELLIKEVDATGEAEGVWFGEVADQIELLRLLIIHQPDEKKWPEYLENTLKAYNKHNP